MRARVSGPGVGDSPEDLVLGDVGRGAIVAFLLTEDALAGTTDGDPLPECALDRPVGIRQRRQVGLLA
jgi:hypothetical protein